MGKIDESAWLKAYYEAVRDAPPLCGDVIEVKCSVCDDSDLIPANLEHLVVKGGFVCGKCQVVPPYAMIEVDDPLTEI